MAVTGLFFNVQIIDDERSEGIVLIFEITVPGGWLDLPAGRQREIFENLIHGLETRFFEANDALNLFEEQQAKSRELGRTPPVDASHTQRAWEIHKQVDAEIRLRDGLEPDAALSDEQLAELAYEPGIRMKREKWRAGYLPWQVVGRRENMYARAFLSALDGFRRMLDVLSKEPGAPGQLADIYAQMHEVFPDLREVRNTAQHMEDRVRGFGKVPYGRPPEVLDPKPIDKEFIQAPDGGVIMLDALLGTKIGSTMADGHYGQVDVSAASMKQLQGLLQSVLEAFRWAGPKRHLPR